MDVSLRCCIYVLTTALEAPIIPDAIDVRENEDISVTCDSSGSIPVTSHTWTDAGGIVVSTDAELTFLDAMRTQAGVYTCTIRDDIGGTAANTTINVLSMRCTTHSCMPKGYQ